MGHLFGRFLRQIRNDAGKSLKEVAEAMGMTHVALSKIERGVSPPLKRKYWDALIDVLRTENEDDDDLSAEDWEKSVRDELDYTARIGNGTVELEVGSKTYQTLGVMLARGFEDRSISDQTAQDIIDLLNKGRQHRGGDE